MLYLSQNNPEKIAIQSGELSLTFAELHHEVQLFSRQLQKLPKAILILEVSQNIRFIIQFLAALYSNQPVALFSNQLSEQVKQERIAILGKAMTIDEQGRLKKLYTDSNIEHDPHLAVILFTSGSTGQVKAVQLSPQNIKANTFAIIKALQFNRVSNQLLFLPLSYSFGLLGQLLPGLLSGLTTQIIEHFTDIKTLHETKAMPQMWSGVPSHWIAISKIAQRYPESAALIKALVSAGAPLSTALRAELKQTFPNAIIYNNYGLTEASPRVLVYSSEDPLFMESYAGYPIGDWEVKLSEDDELLLRGSQMMLGYLGEREQQRIQNGWLHTGDLAEILPNGLVAIKGRMDNLVNIGGEKVYITEIEQRLCHMEGIKEVIILPLDDELYGTRLLACFDKNTLTGLTEQQLTEQIQAHLLPIKLPIKARLLDQLPRNQHGKLDRKALMADNNHFDHKETHHAE